MNDTDKRKSPSWMQFLSHHPSCDHFKNHTLNFGKIKLCIGCFVGYPAAIISIILTDIAYRIHGVNILPLLYLGFILFLAQLFSLTRFSEIKFLKILQKISIGTGSGFILVNLFVLIPSSEVLKVLLSFVFATLLSIPIMILHIKNLHRPCRGCEFENDYINCTKYKDNLFPSNETS
jgi:hypothetical protein